MGRISGGLGTVGLDMAEARYVVLPPDCCVGRSTADGVTTEMLILGLGPAMYPISPETRKFINSFGIRVDVQDTRNAAAQFNLLATERGVGSIAAAMIPIGWKEPK